MTKIVQLKKDLAKVANKRQAAFYQRFFKTGPGEYGEGDKFIGVTVPHQRQVAWQYQDLALGELQKLLNSPIHEHRQTGLLILVNQYQKSSKSKVQKSRLREIFEFYLRNTKKINNWNLVDCSAPYIVGEYLWQTAFRRGTSPKEGKNLILPKLAKSKNLWERRMAMIATFAFIKQGDFKNTLAIAKILMKDNHDLIHKAVGWLLREVGKRDQRLEEKFLNRYYKVMPRTMLRYAIEKFPAAKRKLYLTK